MTTLPALGEPSCPAKAPADFPPHDGVGSEEIGVELQRVAGKSVLFNTILDPIVWIKAGKLRRDLET